MILGRRLALAILVPFLLLPSGLAGQAGVPPDLKNRILDLLIRSDEPSGPFFSKMTLRYCNSGTQFVVLTYPIYPPRPGGRAEVITYKIRGMSGDDFSRFVLKATAQNQNATPQEIAAKLKMAVNRSPISYQALSSLLDQLRTIRTSPLLTSRVALDEYSDYQFWYNTGQESVHYTLVGPSEGDRGPQSRLVNWMIEFREKLPIIMKTHPSPAP
jgi:hypothetical protein